MTHAQTASSRANRITLRARMTLGVTLFCLTVLTLAGIATYLGARAALRQNLDNALLSIARAETTSAVGGPDGKMPAPNAVPAALELASGASYEKFAQIENAADQIVAQTTNLKGVPLRGEPQREAQARAGITDFGDLTRGGDELRVLYYPLRDRHGHSLITLCAISKAPLQQSLHSLENTLLLMLAASAVVAAWGANLLARRLTSPLELIAREARAIDEAGLNRRLSVPSRDAEPHDLAEILNAMLARLETAFTTQNRLMESQRRFLGDASHELRSPLANLRGTIEVALRRPRDADEYRAVLDASMIEIERMSRLVSDLLTLSRAEAGQFSLQFAICDMADVTRRAAAAHQARADQMHLHFCLEAEGPLPVWGDAHRLRQIIDNLIDNALRYAPAASCITLRTERHDAQVMVAVSDAGPGLSDADQARVFDRFYRSDPARGRSTGGLGLGLAIARAFAIAHNGDLTIQSVPGQGATFTLVLPARADALLAFTENG